MVRIKAYVINLKNSSERRAHMEELLSRYDFLDVVFVEAVDGRMLTPEEVNESFDSSLAYRRYGRELERGEIGCVLSHYKCYESIVSSHDEFAFVFEDDISILRDFHIPDGVVCRLRSEKPNAVMYSGDYWYYRKRTLSGDLDLAEVFDCVGAYAYIINNAAAKLLLEKNPKRACVADHWSLYRRFGLSISAVFPYVIDANIGPFESDIRQSHFGENKDKMPIRERVIAYRLALVKKVLVLCGHFVSKIRK